MLLLVGFMAACDPIPTPVSTCDITALTETVAYFRPSLAAKEFGKVAPGNKLRITGRTPDNWYAFDPGVAQAGNAGIFRNRWVQAGPSLSISPTCANLSTIFTKVPQPGITYAVAMVSAPVRIAPNPTADIIYTFSVGDYAQALGISGNWTKVDLATSNINGLTQFGWILQDFHTLNDFIVLPMITP